MSCFRGYKRKLKNKNWLIFVESWQPLEREKGEHFATGFSTFTCRWDICSPYVLYQFRSIIHRCELKFSKVNVQLNIIKLLHIGAKHSIYIPYTLCLKMNVVLRFGLYYFEIENNLISFCCFLLNFLSPTNI